MAAEFTPPAVARRFPTSQRRGRARQARRHAKHVQLPLKIEARQILLVPLQGLQEGPVEEAHVP